MRNSSAVRDLLCLPNFLLEGRSFAVDNRQVPHAIGAITSDGRLGTRSVVTQNLTSIFQSAVEVRRLFVVLEPQGDEYWQLVLEDIQRRDANLAANPNLNIGSLQRVVGMYSLAYCRAWEPVHWAAQRQALERSRRSGLTAPTEAPAPTATAEEQEEEKSRHARLLQAVGSWYILNTGNSSPHVQELADFRGPTPYPRETTQQYILRVNNTVRRILDYVKAAKLEDLRLRKSATMTDLRAAQCHERWHVQGMRKLVKDFNAHLASTVAERKWMVEELGLDGVDGHSTIWRENPQLRETVMERIMASEDTIYWFKRDLESKTAKLTELERLVDELRQDYKDLEDEEAQVLLGRD